MDNTNTNEVLQDYMTAANRRKQFTPNSLYGYMDILTFLGWALVGILLTSILMIEYTDVGQEDFTDSGVGCIDDCLDSE